MQRGEATHILSAAHVLQLCAAAMVSGGWGGECTTRQTSCLQHEKQHDRESESERERASESSHCESSHEKSFGKAFRAAQVPQMVDSGRCVKQKLSANSVARV